MAEKKSFEQAQMGGEREDRLDTSAAGAFQKECTGHREDACFEEGFAERARLRNADAHVLHQPRRARTERVAARRIAKSKSVTRQARGKRKEQDGPRLSLNRGPSTSVCDRTRSRELQRIARTCAQDDDSAVSSRRGELRARRADDAWDQARVLRFGGDSVSARPSC